MAVGAGKHKISAIHVEYQFAMDETRKVSKIITLPVNGFMEPPVGAFEFRRVFNDKTCSLWKPITWFRQ